MKFPVQVIPSGKVLWSLVSSGILLLTLGCTVGPDFHRPHVDTPSAWNKGGEKGATAPIQDHWWNLFHDSQLNRLEEMATQANPSIKSAVARVDQARATVGIVGGRFFPQVGFSPSIVDFHTQVNHVPSNLSATATTIPVDLSYEIDIWGKIRRAVESAQAQAASSADHYFLVLLTLHGDVALNYFLIRQLDTQIDYLEQTQAIREKGVKIVEERFHGGLSPELDVERARTELSTTETQVQETRRQRGRAQNALAILCGSPTPNFEVSVGKLADGPPSIPASLPSELLQRRPDVSEAERKVEAANAQIGVAQAARFPSVSLTGNAGMSSFHMDNLLAWQSHLYQIGPSVNLPLFTGGRLKAGVEEARANYRAVVGDYEQLVLGAFRDVSDALLDIANYQRQDTSEGSAVGSAQRAAASSRERYGKGLINYLDVLDAERTELQAELQLTQIRASRLMATVRLIKALGGGFDSTSKQPHV